ncbi:MAG: hydantoinase B/oxoprolinase family protein [Alphaproteobacteria bacterium]|nr:hydantoinase B/oxoprolinase family protein [Alphaproteobacteria bacterium]MCB9929517.1 hydantoinase B/oxoprolinase family protein [Alphaproteobacteria bacterium]
MASATVDPVQLEIIRNALVAAAEEMSVTIWRTSRSTVVREMLDYSTQVFDGKGRAVAQAARIPVHLNSMSVCLDRIVRDFLPLEDWNDGDVILTNDPYCGGQHLPDFVAFKPVFADGVRVGIAATIVHHIDVGGGAAGSYFPQAREVYHEGLRIPPCKVVEAGKLNTAVVAIIRQNSREPDQIGGDFASQLAAMEIGAQGLRKLARRYGADGLQAAMDALQDQSDRTMRAMLRDLPDGTYRFTDYVDDDGISNEPLRLECAVTIAGDTAEVDFSGSSPQAVGPVNCTLNMTASGIYCAFAMLADGKVMANSGAYRAIAIRAEEGTVVSARAPAPVANRMATGHRVVTTVLGALAQAAPDRVPAAYYGVSYVQTLSTPDPATGAPRVYFEIEIGGWGGHPEQDGADAFSAGFHNSSATPVELNEAYFPLTFTEYSLIPDSGGAGKHRGGTGLRRAYRLDAPTSGWLSGNFERFTVPPYGLAGGEPGRPGRFYLVRDGKEQALPSKIANQEVRPGDVVVLETAGGGGFGNPVERDDGARARDVAGGYVSG